MTPSGADNVEVSRFAVSESLVFLHRTLELAQTMLAAARGSSNPDHSHYCLTAAREFHHAVDRQLSRLEGAQAGRGEIEAAARMLDDLIGEAGY
jgi:hypothetical protein